MLLTSLMLLGLANSANLAFGNLEPKKTVNNESAVAQEEAPPLPAVTILNKGEEVLISVEGRVGSKISATGDIFPIRLARAIEVDGIEVVPAGLHGAGQVVHAKKGGMGGAPGELVLVARYLDYDGRRLELRSFRFADEGDEILNRGSDNEGLANVASVAVGLGFLVNGGNTTIEPGTLAVAKIRNDEVFTAKNEGSDDQAQ